MSQPQLDPTTAAPSVLESGTYEIIRNRLANHGNELRSRLARLNEARKAVFGSIDTTLLGSERITTAHNCVPRDMVAIGRRFIFGYNVHFGLKTEMQLADVFAVYEFRDGTFHEQPLDLIVDERFAKDFQDVYRYYKHAVFARFFSTGPHLFMVFRVGKSVSDIKTFKWVVQGDRLTYLDNRSDHEVRFPPQHEFEWTRTHRDLHHHGTHPHISIEDRVFVETVGGDLTIKIENNTDSGEGIYSEPVDDPDQTLDDAEIYYAILGNLVLLKIRPYQEQRFRYIIFNEKTRTALRFDAIEHACVLLPDDHGLIFSNGYYLQDGEHKTFEGGVSGMQFARRVASPNGEDYLYAFYNPDSGEYVLLQYNLIEQQVDTPIVCNGFTFFAAGELICFKAQADPQKHHALQIWQTPYTGEDHVPVTQSDSFLSKVGNRGIVRGMAECHEVLNLIRKEDTYANLYTDLVKLTGGVIDSYFWIGNAETFNLKEPLTEIKNAASAAVEEFDKVVRVKHNTAAQTSQVSGRTKQIMTAIAHRRFEQIGEFVSSLGDLRAVRGDVIALRELRYIDSAVVDGLEAEVSEQTERLAQRCVQFLLQPSALEPYDRKVAEEQSRIGTLQKVTDAKQVEQDISASAAELEMLIDIVSNLKIDDATQRTTIIDNISAIFSKVNQARAVLKKKAKELMSVEGIAEFNSQMKLLNQSVVNYLDVCDAPQKCEDFLTKMMIQIEELEGRFAEFDEFVVQLTDKREEVYNAFETRKLALVEARNKRATALMNAADRILKGIKARVDSLTSINEIHGYFAADLMIDKVRDIVRQLQELDDSVKVDDIQSRLKTIREDAVRQLKDRQELFVGGENVIKFGNHHFSVNVQTVDLTTVQRDGRMHLHLTGTNFFELITDERLNATRAVWDQEVVSENRDVYRGEYLAYHILRAVEAPSSSFNRDPAGSASASVGVRPNTLPAGSRLNEHIPASDQELLAHVQRFMGPRYHESYVKGVHDHDAAKILRALLDMQATIGLLRFHTRARALAIVFWNGFGDDRHKSLMAARLKGFGSIVHLFPDTAAQTEYIAELHRMLLGFVSETKLFPETLVDQAAEYLFCELTQDNSFAVSQTAANVYHEFQTHLQRNKFTERFEQSIAAVQRDPASCFRLLRDWVTAFLARQPGSTQSADVVNEVAAHLMDGKLEQTCVIAADVSRTLSGMTGSHAVIDGDKYQLDYTQFMLRLGHFERHVVPRFNECVAVKKELVERAREEMRLDEFRPRVLTSFVRNRLIDSVYLPLVGDNLAKQIGVVGEHKRTDLMGLLLLVSPPGYGKTTLMEYIANRLGVIFMKINGPAIGHHITSLDPAEAPNAGAREELEKLNLAFELGDNVMIYLDDIQHTNPELLQKFISLCDAQRKIEGVYKGKTRTYDLRGKKVCVVMAGNPYTESGQKFKLPDMLTNRADVYNLGEIIGETADVFEMSYLENALTSNPTLSKLASRSQSDVYAIIKMAQDDTREGISLEGNYSVEEVNELVATMKKLMRVRDVVLTINREYIRSAAQAEEYRTEPPFKLQGSYRNMNRIAGKVVPIMNDHELQTLIVSNYENDAQTLTSDTESNLLKFKELIGILTDVELQRWSDIKKTFQRNLKFKGVGSDDKVGQVIVQLSSFGEGLEAIRDAMTAGVARLTEQDGRSQSVETFAASLIEQVGGLRDGLASISTAVTGSLQRLAELSPQPQQPPPVAARPASPAADPDVTFVPIPMPGADYKSEITVVNKIPPTLLNVLEQQFHLMQAWMEPLLHASLVQNAELQELRQQLQKCLDDYTKLLGRLGHARRQPKKSK